MKRTFRRQTLCGLCVLGSVVRFWMSAFLAFFSGFLHVSLKHSVSCPFAPSLNTYDVRWLLWRSSVIQFVTELWKIMDLLPSKSKNSVLFFTQQAVLLHGSRLSTLQGHWGCRLKGFYVVLSLCPIWSVAVICQVGPCHSGHGTCLTWMIRKCNPPESCGKDVEPC